MSLCSIPTFSFSFTIPIAIPGLPDLPSIPSFSLAFEMPACPLD